MSKKSLSIALISFVFLNSCAGGIPVTTQTTQTTIDFLSFTPDQGLRLEDASNAGVRMSEDGVLHLIYQDRQLGGDRLATSTEDSDWLDFERGEQINDRTNFYMVKLADGTYKTYGYNPTKGLEDQTCLTSKSSTDGINFTEDSGCRYTLQANDNGTMGVWDVFTNQKGEVVLLYIGDMLGGNTVREAISTDNGETFTFYKDNVLGDVNNERSYVDERSIRMDDGRILLVAMKSGSIYEFISEDDGETFIVNPEPILTKETYPSLDGLNTLGLNDPQLVELPDGLYRIYVTLSMDEGTPGDVDAPSHIVSATNSL